MGIKVIITGSTGMVGKGVLLECVDDPRVDSILLINRHPVNLPSAKIREIIHPDFFDFSPLLDALRGYDACFFCLGISAVGLSEAKYSRITYDITIHLANLLKSLNPAMVFCYVSGDGTDSSEKGKIMWARVKGKTENAILKLGFKDAYAFRPGLILPERGVKSRTGWYNAFYVLAKPFFPWLRKQSFVTTTSRIGKAMITVACQRVSKKHLENRDINKIASGLDG